MKITNTFRTDITDDDRINTYLEILATVTSNESKTAEKDDLKHTKKCYT